MIYYVTHHDFSDTVWRLKRKAVGRELDFIRPVSYRHLFQSLKAPVGHYIFTDFDRLSAYEVQVADMIARRVKEAAPEARILNRPALVLERYPLLRRLAAEGLNDFSAYRLDADEMPKQYPVFIRIEDDCKKPDTGLLNSEEELTHAVRQLRESGVPMKRRIAVEFCAEKSPDGYYRKYGVFNIGGELVVHHIQRNTDWYVKLATREATREPAFDEEQFAYARDIPHAAEIRRVFAIANIDYGRIDYAIVGGRLQTYEINTNPTAPRISLTGGKTVHPARRAIQRERMLKGFRDIDAPISGPSYVTFEIPRPRMHKFDPLPIRSRLLEAYQRLKLATGR